jgi:transposase
VETLEAENAELRRRLGMNSTNSSVPPSKDSIEAKAKRRADRSSRERSKDRKPGGQPGRKGSGLAPTVTPDRTETLPPPGECSGCGGDLAGAVDAGMSWAQVWDILAVTLEKVHYLLPRRRCGCGKITTAAPPFGAAGTVSYGPNINTAAILLASQGNVPIERTAQLMEALLGVSVSSGFVARALERFAQRLAAAGFDDAMKTALRAEDVLCADETPTNVVRVDTDAHGKPVAGSPHAVTVRTPDARRVYYAPIGSRSKTAIADLGVLAGYAGYLVRDDYAGYYQFDAQLAGVQQCAAHLIRHCKACLSCTPASRTGPARSSPCCARPPARSLPPKPTNATTSTPRYSPTCAPATTKQSPGESSPTSTATGPAATIPDIPSPAAWPPKPTKSGPSPETSPCPGQTTPPNRPSKDQNDIKPSPGTGTR